MGRLAGLISKIKDANKALDSAFNESSVKRAPNGQFGSGGGGGSGGGSGGAKSKTETASSSSSGGKSVAEMQSRLKTVKKEAEKVVLEATTLAMHVRGHAPGSGNMSAEEKAKKQARLSEILPQKQALEKEWGQLERDIKKAKKAEKAG